MEFGWKNQKIIKNGINFFPAYRLRDRFSFSLSSFSESDFLASRFIGINVAVEPLTWTGFGGIVGNGAIVGIIGIGGIVEIDGIVVSIVFSPGRVIVATGISPVGGVSLPPTSGLINGGNTYSCVSKVLNRSSTKFFVSEYRKNRNKCQKHANKNCRKIETSIVPFQFFDSHNYDE